MLTPRNRHPLNGWPANFHKFVDSPSPAEFTVREAAGRSTDNDERRSGVRRRSEQARTSPAQCPPEQRSTKRLCPREELQAELPGALGARRWIVKRDGSLLQRRRKKFAPSSIRSPAHFCEGCVFQGRCRAMDTVPDGGPPSSRKGNAHHGADDEYGSCTTSQVTGGAPTAFANSRIRRHRSNPGLTRAALCAHLSTSVAFKSAGPAIAGTTCAGTSNWPIIGSRRPNTQRMISAGSASVAASLSRLCRCASMRAAAAAV